MSVDVDVDVDADVDVAVWWVLLCPSDGTSMSMAAASAADVSMV